MAFIDRSTFSKTRARPSPKDAKPRHHQNDMIIFRLGDSYKPVFATVPGYLEDHPNLSRVVSLPHGLNGFEMVVTNHSKYGVDPSYSSHLGNKPMNLYTGNTFQSLLGFFCGPYL